jgi:hypothetical protein
MGRNNQIILNSYNQSKVFGKNNQENNQENNQADYFYQTGPKSLGQICITKHTFLLIFWLA